MTLDQTEIRIIIDALDLRTRPDLTISTSDPIRGANEAEIARKSRKLISKLTGVRKLESVTKTSR